MATLITKNSSTAAAVPGTGDLVQGELAVNVADKRLFTKNSGGSVVEVGTNPSSLVVEGNVGVGVTPGNPLDVTKTGIQIGSTTAYSVARFRDATPNKGVSLGYDSGSQTSIVLAQTASASSNLAFWTFESGGSGWAERMRLDYSGNLGLGVTPSAWVAGSKALQVGSPGSLYTSLSQATGGDSNLTNNVYLSAASTWTALASLGASRYQLDFGSHKWYTASSGTAGNAISFTQAMTLDASGNLLVGTTTIPSSSNAGFAVPKDADGTYLRNACTITSTRTHFEFVNGNGTVGSISTNGSATSFNTSSDRRLKENIHPAGDAASVIDAIEVVQHDWKAGGHTRFGVIAQDLHAVAPEAVTPGDDGEEIEKTWGVDYSKLVAMLIKEIQSLRARVAALEQV
jgi:hypothetical protein